MPPKTNSNRKTTNVWFFVGRSIGVTLLGLYALEQAQSALGAVQTRQFLVFTHRSALYKEILSMYPHIELVYLRWGNLTKIFLLFWQVFFQKNIFTYAPSFGRPPLLIKIFSRLITLLHPGSCVTGAFLQRKTSDYFWYSRTLVSDLNKSIFTAVTDMLPVTDKPELISPSLLFSYDASLRVQLPQKYIAFHPFAASEQRTYPDSLSQKLIKYLIRKYPEYTIIISGGPADEERTRNLINQIEHAPGTLNIMQAYSQNSFAKTIQVLSGAQLYIGVDTGITHLAAHLLVPSVVLGNRSNPMWLPTYASHVTVLVNEDYCTCTPDKRGDCRREIDGIEYYRCMVDISWQSLCSAIELRLHG